MVGKKRGKKAQVWIETMVYTLIALTIISLVLMFVKPKIQEIQDKIVIDQTVDAMRILDGEIFSVLQTGSGNIRDVELEIKKGSLTVDGGNEKLIFKIEESRVEYSEPEVEIDRGSIKILTIPKGSLYDIILTADYTDKFDLSYDENLNGKKTITRSPSPYKILISNLGEVPGNGDITQIDIKIT